MRGVANDSANIKAVLQYAQFFCVAIDNGDVVLLDGEVLGVEATLINEEFQVLLANMRDAEITQVFRSSWMGDYNDAHTFLSVLQSDSAANMPRYKNEEFDALMALAAEQIDQEQRKLYLEEAERVMLADYPLIPIYFFVSKHLVSPEIEGWGDNVLDYHYSQQLSFKAVP